jgi:hypothetical protein
VEANTLGLGFLVKPTLTDISPGENAASVIERLLAENGFASSHSGSAESGYYLTGISPVDQTAVAIPDFITLEADEDDINYDDRTDLTLRSYDYYDMSGWMFTINDAFSQVGASDCILEPNDVLRLQFSVYGWGADLGVKDGFGFPNIIDVCDKTELTWRVAELRSRYDDDALELNESYAAALTALTDAAATQDEVNAALSKLNYIAPPEKTALKNAIALASSRARGNYTPESLSALQMALSAAKLVEDDDSATQDDADAATESLNAAIAALVTIPAPTYDAALAEALKYIRNATPNPSVGSVGGEWAVLALARAGISDAIFYNNWLENLKNLVSNDPSGQVSVSDGKVVMHSRKYTENERIIIALSAIGLNAENYNGWDFVAALTDRQPNGEYQAVWQGLNGAIFALIALDSNGYLSDNASIRGEYVEYILENADDDVGWSIFGMSKHDMTAMSIQALAPYYGKDNVALDAAVNEAIEYLSGQQTSDGVIGGSLEGTAQTVIALCALGVDPGADPRFVKGENNLIDGLLLYREADGGFSHSLDGAGGSNQMASEQAAYALAAFDRFVKGLNALYDMADATDLTVTIPAVVKDALLAEILKAEGLNASSYETSSWSALQTALAAAKSAAANPDATQTVVDAVKTALTSAISALKTDGGSGGGSNSGGSSANDKINVTFRLIGATLASEDVDISANANDSAYVTWIPTGGYTLNKNSSVYDLFSLALANAGLSQIGAEKNYVETIFAPFALGGYKLSELTNGRFSGWMYTINGRHPGYGLAEHKLNDGDAVIWHYVNDYRHEVEDWFDDLAYPALGDGSQWNKWLNVSDRAPSASNGGANDGGGYVGSKTPSDPAIVTENAAELEIKAVIKNGEATVDIKTDDIKKAIDDAKDKKSDAVTVAVTGANGAGDADISLQKDAVSELVKSGLALIVKTPVAEMGFSAAALREMGFKIADAESLHIVAAKIDDTADLSAAQREKVGGNPAFSLSAHIGGKLIQEFNGDVTVKAPYAPPELSDAADWDLLTVYSIDDEGGVSEMADAKYDAETGIIAFTAKRFSKFFITEWVSPLNDVSKADWFYRAVRFNYSNKLIVGVTKDIFAPKTNLTREMFVTILAREAGVDTSGGETWRQTGVEWGVTNGIIDGADMDADITREEMASMLYRRAKLKNFDVSATADLSGYSDARYVSDWASDAVSWANASGLLVGRESTALAPGDTATRAEAAAVLQRFVKMAA